MNLLLALLVNYISFVTCPYPPSGDEVVPGSVLLPASRRGRYLANIVRRQAVDGTGIKFNKDADRMNAEAKKKVDVLSDELLPYIIAEQERRITLYKRIMTAIQNGEKGVTIAEIRNKPPVMIRKGLMYRCPSNRAPIEPDGSGSLMCEEQIEPTQVMYDSCLSAEDKDLYVADGKYFFCNRHKVEGPDLPRNGTTVIGCAPIERTSLNYTTSKCALEDTEDVVVHYRYYPDRSYKFVTELDPDHEVCDHWNPCQIGYIFALPSSDVAIPANELWRGYTEHFGEYERDEIVPPVPEDAYEEFVSPQMNSYTSSPRRVAIPKGHKFSKLWAKRTIDDYGWNPANNQFQCTAEIKVEDNFVAIKLKFPEQWSDFFYSTYYAVFTKGLRSSGGVRVIKFLTISMSSAHVVPEIIQASHGQTKNLSTIPFKCTRCRLQGIMIRTHDGHVYNVDPANYRMKDDRYLEIDLLDLKPWQYGDYFAIVQNADGIEERLKVLSLLTPEIDENNEVQVARKSASLALGAKYDEVMEFKCENDPECTLNNVLCNGESAMAAGRVSLTPISKKVTFTFPSFDDSLSCVYMGEFSCGGHIYQKTLLVVEQNSDAVKISEVKTIPLPKLGEQFEHTIPFTCASECTVEKVTVNGVPLQSQVTRRSGSGMSIAFFIVTGNSIIIRITEFSMVWAGLFQGKFIVEGEEVTRTIMDLGDKDSSGGADDDGTSKTSDAKDANDASDAKDAKDAADASNSADGGGNSGGAGDKKKINEACTKDSTECIDNAECPAEKCACVDKFTPNDDGTKCLLKIEEACAAPGPECVANAKCDSTCTCETGFTPNADKTKCEADGGASDKKKINEACTKDSTECIDNAECPAEKCACVDKFTPNDDGTKCLLKIEEACAAPGPECVANAKCDGKCTCETGFTPNADKTKCEGDGGSNAGTAKKKLGEDCTQATECIDNTECVDSAGAGKTQCTCLLGFEDTAKTNEQCTAKVIGSDCKTVEDCKHITDAECASDKCACPADKKVDADGKKCE